MGRGHRIIHNVRGIDKISPVEVYGAVRAIMKDLPLRERNASILVSVSKTTLGEPESPKVELGQGEEVGK